MGRLEVTIRHGGGHTGLAGLGTLAVIAAAAVIAAEVIVQVIWWLITATAGLAVAAGAGAFLVRRATARGEARFAAGLAARRAVPPPPDRRALPPAPQVHLHFHGADHAAAARIIRDALPGGEDR